MVLFTFVNFFLIVLLKGSGGKTNIRTDYCSWEDKPPPNAHSMNMIAGDSMINWVCIVLAQILLEAMWELIQV